MKRSFLLACLLFAFKIGFAQITLEHTYDSASIQLNNNLFYMVDLEVDSYKYVRIYVQEPQIRFYNLDHSIWKTIDMSSFQTPPALKYGVQILYISQHLFNSDDSIEFLYTVVAGDSISPPFTAIYNEAGTVLFMADSLAPLVSINVPQAMRPIYNTPVGTKMILSHINGTANVYSLGGTLTASIDMVKKSEVGFNLSPTPASEFTKVNFSLPPGITEAQIIVTDIGGNKIKQYNVDNTFTDLLINNRDFTPGTYLFSLHSQSEVVTQKQVIIH